MSRALIRAAALVVLFSLGCQHGPYAPREYRAGTTSYEHTEKIIFADRTLASKVRVVSTRKSVEEDGRLRAYAELENRTAKNLAVQVQTQFRNEAGALTQDVTNWRTMVMAPNSVTLYESTSMSDTARDFIIRVKWEKRH
jgi:hypothetical protein